jgi:Flp pilus assembly protein TadD
VSPTATTAVTARRTWIVSPGWDLFYLVLTPVLIVPVVVVAVRRWLTPEQVYLAVISFASLGHHLPGFMRAYGDRELFVRYRWRFLVAPPLVFALALAFTPPASVRSALGLPWVHLHGLELILLVWGTWHGLMQTYGFMRIYDLRRGENDRSTARLDHALCVAMFVAGVVFSDTRMFSTAGAMWQAGLPLFGPEALSIVRWSVGGASVMVAALYAKHLIDRRRRGVGVNWVKLLLAVTTGWFWWYCGRLSTNLLVGVAMFEIFHAVQYNAIVWIYNRRLLERAGERFGPLGFLFRDRLTMLGVYLGLIAAYSSIRFFTAQPDDRMFSGDLANAHQWLVAWFVASSMLHFYYDGFIWKVSERQTRENLVDAPLESPGVERFVSGMVHAGKWGTLLAIAAFLALAEREYQGEGGAKRQTEERRALAALAPDVPEALMLASQEALAEGRWADAMPMLERLVAVRPGRWEHHCDLGECLSKLGEPERAAVELQRAIALAPTEAEPRYQLGLARLLSGDAAGAIEPLRRAVQLDPTHFRAHLQLGDALMAEAKTHAAVGAYREAVTLRPEAPTAWVCLADALVNSGRMDDAEGVLREGLKRNPDSPELCFTLGLVLRQSGQFDEAARLLERAETLGLKAP